MLGVQQHAPPHPPTLGPRCGSTSIPLSFLIKQSQQSDGGRRPRTVRSPPARTTTPPLRRPTAGSARWSGDAWTIETTRSSKLERRRPAGTITWTTTAYDPLDSYVGRYGDTKVVDNEHLNDDRRRTPTCSTTRQRHSAWSSARTRQSTCTRSAQLHQHRASQFDIGDKTTGSIGGDAARRQARRGGRGRTTASRRTRRPPKTNPRTSPPPDTSPSTSSPSTRPLAVIETSNIRLSHTVRN